ncbi:MAG: hypothetical protein ABMA01_05580 [Chthoniobacteraceae bacterium]
MKSAFLILRYGILPLIAVVVVFHFLWEDIRLFLGVVILCGGYLGFSYISLRSRFRRLGFRVVRSSRDTYRYEELFGDRQHRSLDINGEMLVGAPHVIYLPSPSTWQATVLD